MSKSTFIVWMALLLLAPAASAGDARHLHKSDCVNPQMFAQMTGCMGVVLDGPGQGLPVGKSTTAVVRPLVGDKTTAMSRAGFKPGDKVKVSHTKGGILKIERVGGTPLSVLVGVMDFYRPEQILDWGGHIGIKFDGKMALLGKGDACTGHIDQGRSVLLFDKGYIKKDRVTVTNLGGGKMKIDRMPPGKPLSTVLNANDFIREHILMSAMKAASLTPNKSASGMLKGDKFKAVIGGHIDGGKSTLLFDKGYIKGDQVEVTNLGDGKLKIDRLAPGKPLSIEVGVMDFFTPDRR